MLENEKIFYNPGDIVEIRQPLLNKPIMVVKEKVQRNLMKKDGDKESIFIGIKCFGFNHNGDLVEAVFSTKDLIHVE